MAVDRSSLPSVGSDPFFRFPEIVRHTLSTGLELRTIEHRAVPVVTFVLQLEAGSGADQSSREGLAAITADMVDEGTGALSAIDVSDSIARIGAEYDVDVGPEVEDLLGQYLLDRSRGDVAVEESADSRRIAVGV